MYLISGFPGFLGRHLAEELQAHSNVELIFLVQKKFIPLAHETAASIGLKQYQIVEGDIGLAGLGLQNKDILQKVSRIYHLAAVYDLSVSREFAYKINVEGTQNIINLAKELPNLDCLHYVSTCYVSGKHPGVFCEQDLICQQAFNNFYEETKYLAEVLVQEAMKNGLAATIYRPGIVAGHSETGFTPKFDGPYYILQWLERQGKKAILPKIANYDQYYTNIVPVDFVAKAIAGLSNYSDSLGKVYQLADPYPPSIQDFLELCEHLMNKKIILLPLPKFLADFSLRYVPFVQDIMKINPDTIDYFSHPTRYDTKNASHDLEKIGIECPELSMYLVNLLTYMRSQEKLNTNAMV